MDRAMPDFRTSLTTDLEKWRENSDTAMSMMKWGTANMSSGRFRYVTAVTPYVWAEMGWCSSKPRVEI
jgi:hypothetical protein